MWETSRNKLKCVLLPRIVLTFHCLNKLFQWSQILGLQPPISSFSRSLEQFFLTVDQNNFGNKIPFLVFKELTWSFANIELLNAQIMRILSKRLIILYSKIPLNDGLEPYADFFFLQVISQGKCDRNFTKVCNGTILLFIVSTSQCNNIRENMVNIRTLGLQENGGKHFNMLVFICHQNEKQMVYTTHFCRLSKLDWE